MQRPRTQTPVIAPDLVVPIVEDDTEEAPWMVMGDAQFWAAAHLATSLHHYAQVHGRPWYVASLLPIVYRRRGEKRTRQVAPDVLVAFVPQRPRDSYDIAAEGGFPAFVLEVVSSSGVARDVDAKRRLYEALGAQEYVLFAPEPGCWSHGCKATGAAQRGALSRGRLMRRGGCGATSWSCGWHRKGACYGRCKLMGNLCSPTRRAKQRADRRRLRVSRRPRHGRGRRRSWPVCEPSWSERSTGTDSLW
jgi:hypothetical protein